MDEYIKRETAIKALINDAPEQVGYSREDAADCIRYMDAADVAPVRHGRWISYLDGDHIMPERYYRCSRCGRVESSRQPYCHCGAKMDLEG